jgi:ATP-dependent exoDNAse (exonuclease V) alpha subunit
LVLTGTRAEARQVNREIQLERKLRGELGERIRVGEETFHVGDRVLFRKNSKKLGVTNGDFGDVVRVSKHGMTVRLQDGTRVTVHEDAVSQVQPHLGYAATTHSAQGATVDRCLVLVGGVMQDREATYVQASRARVETRIYSDKFSAGEEFEELTRSMERSRAKDLASDLMAHEHGEGQELHVA